MPAKYRNVSATLLLTDGVGQTACVGEGSAHSMGAADSTRAPTPGVLLDAGEGIFGEWPISPRCRTPFLPHLRI